MIWIYFNISIENIGTSVNEDLNIFRFEQKFMNHYLHFLSQLVEQYSMPHENKK